MKLIPVIDLQGGLVVAARLGRRCDYAPLTSPLCPSSALQDVVADLLAFHPFDTLYIADLDAIAGGAGNLDRIAALHRAYPRLSLWVDNGLTTLDRLTAIARPVIGSESLVSFAHLAKLRETYPDAVLSLDYLGDQLKGPDGLNHRPDLWLKSVILMTLTRVGSGGGPDLERLGSYRRRAPDFRLFAAGGVRHLADLEQLRDLGVAGALVSTALHQGAIPSNGISALANRNPAVNEVRAL
jgi:phosphoribosylformimino-5-aminoimidazole carboxamide ribotide isomerase